VSDSTPLSLSDARHLLRRTGFGATQDAAQNLLDDAPTRGDAADILLAFEPTRFKPGGKYIEDRHNKWVKYMIKTKRQLQEKLVLFWHDHFATSYDKVGDVDLMSVQNRLFRQFCKGNFKDFVKAINKDPAMMEFLDTVRNNKDQPNENYARELQELFTLGVKSPLGDPNYDQEDIVQIARAFSGWDYNSKGVASLDDDDHDKGDTEEEWDPPRGPKVIYKTRGAFNDVNGQSFDAGTNYAGEIDLVIDIIFQHRYGPSGSERSTVADYIAQKLITYFAHPDPAPAFVQAVVDDSGFAATWDLSPLLKAIFVHDDFYLSAAPPGAGTKKSVKWPIDYVVGTLRMCEMKLKSKTQFLDGGSISNVIDHLTNMGQLLFFPPSVFGWDWETSWLSSSTLLARYAFARDLTGAREGSGKTSFRADRLIDLGLGTAGDIVDAVTALLGVDDQISTAERDALIAYLTDGTGTETTAVDLSDETLRKRKLNGLVATVLQSPIYQLH
jgi:uncharacterized protein (DUF1800 family)